MCIFNIIFDRLIRKIIHLHIDETVFIWFHIYVNSYLCHVTASIMQNITLGYVCAYINVWRILFHTYILYYIYIHRHALLTLGFFAFGWSHIVVIAMADSRKNLRMWWRSSTRWNLGNILRKLTAFRNPRRLAHLYFKSFSVPILSCPLNLLEIGWSCNI